MAEKGKEKEVVEQRAPITISYTAEEVEYQENLLGKLMTLDHLRGMLSRDESDKAFVSHIIDMKNEYQSLYIEFIQMKRAGFKPAPAPKAAPAESTPDEDADASE